MPSRNNAICSVLNRPAVRTTDPRIAGHPPVDRLSLHFVDGQGFLLDPASERLYALNTSATLVWSLVTEGRSEGEICQILISEYGVPADDAARFLSDLLGAWDTAQTSNVRGSAAQRFAPNFGRPRVAVAETRHYRLHDTTFRVAFASAALCAAVHPLLEGLATDAGAPALDVAIEPAGDAVSIVTDGREIGFAPSIEAAAVAARASLTQLAVEKSGGLCAVHGGALGASGRALLLPGNAGHGKSTLSAGLAAAGFAMLSDDTTLLAGQPLRVAPLPTGLCIKRGAYGILDRLFPRLAELTEWSRPDGLLAKYLMPGLDLPWATEPLPAQWLVFPHYDPGHVTSLVPLARPQALERLLPGVYFLSGTMDAANLDALIAWIGGIDCYELPLSSLDEAVALLRGLCR